MPVIKLTTDIFHDGDDMGREVDDKRSKVRRWQDLLKLDSYHL